MSVMRRLRRSFMSKVFWSRTDRNVRPERSSISLNTMLASLSPPGLKMASSRICEPGVCGRSCTRRSSVMPWCSRHGASHSVSTFGGTSVCTRCWCCVDPEPIALVVAV